MSERDLFRLFQKPEKPPLGLETIRAWIRKPRPLLRSAWDWVPLILSRLPKAWDFVKKQRAPAAKLLRRAAAKGEPLAKGAAWFGRMLVEVGDRAKAALDAFQNPPNRRSDTADKLGEGADTLVRLGRVIAAGASVLEKVIEIMIGLGKLLQPRARTPILPEPPTQETPKPAETPAAIPRPRPSPEAEPELPPRPLPSPERPPVPQPEPPPAPAPPERSPEPQPAPQPEPQPAPRPEPQPAPQPEPQPAPRPEPQPAPQLEPQPAPRPEPQPDPQPEPAPPEPAPLPPEPASPEPQPEPAPPDPPADPLPPEPAPDPDPATSRPVESRKAAPPSPPPKPALPDLTGLPRVLHRRVLALGRRPLAEVLRVLILDICLLREWSTAAELAGWLSRHQPSLVARHIRPLLKEDLLKLKFPDRPNSPGQAYQTRKDRWPPKN